MSQDCGSEIPPTQLSQADYEERKGLLEQINILVQSEQEHIFRILKNSGEGYSENCNGVFFDVAGIKPTTFAAIRDYISICTNVRKSQEDRINEMNRLRGALSVAAAESKGPA